MNLPPGRRTGIFGGRTLHSPERTSASGRYLECDLSGDDGKLRSSVSKQAVREDAQHTCDTGTIRTTLDGLTAAPVLLRAARGLLDDQPLYSDDYVAGWPEVVHRDAVPGTNHYTIVFAPSGVEAVAEEVRRAVGDAAGAGMPKVVERSRP